MGLKENFAQAVRELTGGGKEENSNGKKGVRVENLRRGIEDDRFDNLDKSMEHDFKGFQGNSSKKGGKDLKSLQKDFTGELFKNSKRDFTKNKDFTGEIFKNNAGNKSTAEEEKSSTAPVLIPTSLELNPTGNISREDKDSDEPIKDFYAQTNPGAYSFSADLGKTDNLKGAVQNSPLYTHKQAESPIPPPPTPPPSAESYPNIKGAIPSSPNSGSLQGQALAQTPVFRNIRPEPDDEITMISKNTVIDGNIRSFANMSIDGDIKGDVETTKNIDLNGRIVGNITCNNAEMHESQIQGNIRMKGSIDMERDTLLIGDIVSTYAKVNGKVKGNLDVAGKAELKSDAVVFGDISASTLTVDDGAIIQGYVSTTFLNKEESRNIFPDVINISE